MFNKELIVGLVAIVIAIGGWFYPVAVQRLGAEGDTNYTNLVLDGTLAVTGASTLTGTVTHSGLTTLSATTTAKNIVVTQSNTATSTLQVGCVNTYATSTASPIKLMFFASSTLNVDGASITAGFGGGTQQGLVLWGFGNCPLI